MEERLVGVCLSCVLCLPTRAEPTKSDETSKCAISSWSMHPASLFGRWVGSPWCIEHFTHQSSQKWIKAVDVRDQRFRFTGVHFIANHYILFRSRRHLSIFILPILSTAIWRVRTSWFGASRLHLAHRRMSSWNWETMAWLFEKWEISCLRNFPICPSLWWSKRIRWNRRFHGTRDGSI